MDPVLEQLIQEQVQESKARVKAKTTLDESAWPFETAVTKLPAYKTYDMWADLAVAKHWHASNRLITFYKEGNKLPHEQELVEIIIQQVIEAKAEAAGYPRVSSLWKELQPHKPFSDYLTEQDIATGINHAWWKLLETSANQWRVNDSVNEELNNLLTYTHFHKLFDYGAGVDKAQKLPDNIRFSDVYDIDYLKWYAFMQDELLTSLGEEQAAATLGKLAAPLVHQAFSPNYDSQDEQTARALMNAFIQKDVLNTTPVQEALAERYADYLFEYYSQESFDPDTLRTLKRALRDPQATLERFWPKLQEALQGTDLSNFSTDYLPAGYFAAQITEHKKTLLDSTTIQPEALGAWNRLINGQNIPARTNTAVHNHVATLYFNQQPRPKKADLLSLQKHLQHKNNHKVQAYLFLDLLKRNGVEQANTILIEQEQKSFREASLFRKHLEEYVTLYGPVRIQEKQLDKAVCKPHFNYLPDFAAQNKKLFSA